MADRPHFAFPFERARVPELVDVLVATNLEPNPSFEVDLTGVGASSGDLPTRTNSDSAPGAGSWSAQTVRTPPPGSFSIGLHNGVPGAPYAGHDGEKITVSAWAKAIITGDVVGTVRIRLRFFDAANSVIEQPDTTRIPSVSGEWVRPSGTFTVPAGTVGVGISVLWSNLADATSVTYRADGILWTAGDQLYDYFDGDLIEKAIVDRPAGVAVVEQDTIEHVMACENVILHCPIGFRLDRPEFGTPWPEYHNRPDPGAIQAAVQRWEDRSETTARDLTTQLEAAVGEAHIEVAAEAPDG